MKFSIAKVLWGSLVFFPVFLILFPFAFLFFQAAHFSLELWSHIFEHLFWKSFFNTILLVLGVSLVTIVIGGLLAWLQSQYRLWGSSFLEKVLVLPLAFPTYVVAFLWNSFWGQEQGFFQLLCVLALCYYPYVYLPLRDAFSRLSSSPYEVAQSLGTSRFLIFKKVTWPLLAPSLSVGLILVGLETLAEFGSAAVLNVSVLSTLAYRTWFSLQSLETASFLSLFHVGLAVVFLFFFTRSKKNSQLYRTEVFRKKNPQEPTSKILKCFFSFLAWGIWSIAFLFPLFGLFFWIQRDWGLLLDLRLWERVQKSVWIASSVSFLTIALASLIVWGRRFCRPRKGDFFLNWASLGYGVPGTVLAVAWVASASKIFGPLQEQTWIAFSFLILAFSSKFFSLALRPLEGVSQRLSFQVEESAQSLGASFLRIVREIYLPIFSGPLGVAVIFLFVDTLKEMPMTLILRPFGWETLSTRIFHFSSDGLWQAAAAPALLLVFLSLFPVLFLKRTFHHG